MHLGYSERLWLRVVVADEPVDLSWTENRYAPTFVVPDGWSEQHVAEFYRSETALADEVLDRAESLDQRSKSEMRPTTLRWALAHLVETIALINCGSQRWHRQSCVQGRSLRVGGRGKPGSWRLPAPSAAEADVALARRRRLSVAPTVPCRRQSARRPGGASRAATASPDPAV